MSEADCLKVLQLRARFTPALRLSFPGNAAVPIRGALGFCLPDEIFRPRSEAGPSGLRDAPRPFVLRVRNLDGQVFEAGESFEIGVNLFAADLLPAFQAALPRLAENGLSARRIPLQWAGLQVEPRSFRLHAAEPCSGVEVTFVTAMEMKGWSGHGLPPFEVVAARARDRVSALASLYGPRVPALDYRELAERARNVRTVSGELDRVQRSRTSSRTGLTHPLSGVTGHVRYEGELSEYVPLLRAACLTGIGRQTVWGHGEIALELHR